MQYYCLKRDTAKHIHAFQLNGSLNLVSSGQVISNGDAIRWRLSASLEHGLITSVYVPPVEYVQAQSVPAVMLSYGGDSQEWERFVPMSAGVVRTGPFVPTAATHYYASTRWPQTPHRDSARDELVYASKLAVNI